MPKLEELTRPVLTVAQQSLPCYCIAIWSRYMGTWPFIQNLVQSWGWPCAGHPPRRRGCFPRERNNPQDTGNLYRHSGRLLSSS